MGAAVSKYQQPTDAYYLFREEMGKEVFSALGYLFAINMTNKSDVPVGVIEIDATGLPLACFAPNELAEKWGHEIYDEATGTYYFGYQGLSNPIMKTRFIYNQRIYPLKNFSCAGIIWYQGESDWYNSKETYGKDYYSVLKEVVYETDANKAYVKFDYVGAGLKTSDVTGVVKGIEVLINVNGTLTWTKHEGQIITGTDTITIDTGNFELLGVRYNRHFLISTVFISTSVTITVCLRYLLQTSNKIFNTHRVSLWVFSLT